MAKPGLNTHKRSQRKNMQTSTGGEISLEQARNHWLALQRLSTSVACGVADMVRTSGWIYSPGSTGPYLALRARLPACSRAAVDAAVFLEQDPVEVFGPRGCTMLVPRQDVPLALQCASLFFLPHFARVSKACQIAEQEIRDLTSAIVAVLRDGASPAEALRANLPKSLIRKLGEAGRKLGETSTASFVLRKLQADGIVQRIAGDRRLDSERYTYRLPPHGTRTDLPQEQLSCELARRFFGWAAPATLKEFAWWAGISQKEARTAVEKIALRKITIPEWASEAWIPADQLETLRAAKLSRSNGSCSLLPFRDNYLYFRRNLGAFLEPNDRAVKVLSWRNNPAPLGEQESLHHNAVVFRCMLAGAWEFDPKDRLIVWKTWRHLSSALQRELEREMEKLERYIRSDLGDAAFYPFDSDRSRRKRIESLASGFGFKSE